MSFNRLCTVGVFSLGVSLTVRVQSAMLDILMAIPQTYKNKVRGLAGTLNNNTEDDLTTPEGRQLDIRTASESEIFDDFGELCKSELREGNSCVRCIGTDATIIRYMISYQVKSVSFVLMP